jgi:hypothetical protein
MRLAPPRPTPARAATRVAATARKTSATPVAAKNTSASTTASPNRRPSLASTFVQGADAVAVVHDFLKAADGGAGMAERTRYSAHPQFAASRQYVAKGGFAVYRRADTTEA